MTTPLPGDLSHECRRSDGKLVAMTAALALLACVALQIWRPYFFLTDDNVVQYLPPMVEMARNFHEEKSIFLSAFLFGGNYDWSNDASCFAYLSPLLPLLSPLARSRYYFALVDVITTMEFVVVAAAFAAAALWLRRRYELRLGDWALAAVSLSYAFAPLNLIQGASWIGFVNAQAAWPLVFVALQFSSERRAIATLAAAFAFALFGGNLHPFVFLLLGSAGWAGYFSWQQRSARPLLCLATALALVGIMAVLIVGPGLGEIAAAGRVRAFNAATSSMLNVPLPALAASFLLGPIAGSFGGPEVSLSGGGSLEGCHRLLGRELVRNRHGYRRWLAKAVNEARPDRCDGDRSFHLSSRVARGCHRRHACLSLDALAVSRDRRPRFLHSSLVRLELQRPAKKRPPIRVHGGLRPPAFPSGCKSTHFESDGTKSTTPHLGSRRRILANRASHLGNQAQHRLHGSASAPRGYR